MRHLFFTITPSIWQSCKTMHPWTKCMFVYKIAAMKNASAQSILLQYFLKCWKNSGWCLDQAHFMWALVLVPICLQFYKSTDSSVFRIECVNDCISPLWDSCFDICQLRPKNPTLEFFLKFLLEKKCFKM